MAGRYQSAPAANSAAVRALSPPTPPATAPIVSFGALPDSRLGSMPSSSFASQQRYASLPSKPFAASDTLQASVLPSSSGTAASKGGVSLPSTSIQAPFVTQLSQSGPMSSSSFASQQRYASLPSKSFAPSDTMPVSVLPSSSDTAASKGSVAFPSTSLPAQSIYKTWDAAGNSFVETQSSSAAPTGTVSQGLSGQTIFKTQSSFGGPSSGLSHGPPQVHIFATQNTPAASAQGGVSQGPAGYSTVQTQGSLARVVSERPVVVHRSFETQGGTGPSILDTQSSFNASVGGDAVSTAGGFAQPWRKDAALQPLLAQKPSYMAELYGSADPLQVQGGIPSETFSGKKRRRTNFLSMAVAVLVPWVLFSALFAARSFSFHYQQPSLTRLLAGALLVVVLGGGVLAVSARRKTTFDRDDEPPSWGLFICATCLLAWLLAVVGGDLNFLGNMQPFYDILNLNTYTAIDPSHTHGQQVMDAGRIVFSKEARLDLSKAMGFKNSDTYCVAPVTVSNSSMGTVPLAAYDFWAVGINCCSGSPGDFRCGEFNNPHAHAGLRVMRDEQRPFFRLAVQQAEATLGIKAEHPIFLYWLQDPYTEANAYQEDGFRYYLMGMFGHFALQFLLVIVAMLIFSGAA